MRVLWLAGQSFEPRNNGLFIYSSQVANALTNAGAEIRYIGRSRGQDEAPDWTQLPATNTLRLLRGLSLGMPVKIARMAGSDYNEAVRTAVAEFRPDVAVIDHVRAADALSALPADLPVAYCSQNNEARVRVTSLDGVTLRDPRRLPYTWDLGRLRSWEQRLCERSSFVSAITAIDAQSFVEDYGVAPKDTLVMPPPHDGARVENRIIDDLVPRQVLIMTDLRWGLKVDNLHDLLDTIAKPLTQAGVRIVITGHETDQLSDRYPVSGLGFVDSVEQVLADSRIALSFEPRGGGIKMKCIDYALARVPIALLDKDLRGLPLTHGQSVLVASSAQAMLDLCLAAIDDLELLNKLQGAAFEATIEEFQPAVIGTRMYDRLASSI